MKSEEKKYILDNVGKKSAVQIARDLGLKERKVRKFLTNGRSSGPAQGLCFPNTISTRRQSHLLWKAPTRP